MMRQPFAVLLGLAVGVLLAGILAAVQLVVFPETWRTERVLGTFSVLLIGLCAVAAYVWSRDARE